MAPERRLQGLRPAQLQEELAALDEGALRTAAARRGPAFAETVMAAAGVTAEPLSPEDQAFKDAAGDFINPEVELDLDDQLKFTYELHGRLGLVPPKLSSSQKDELRQTLAANPGKRLVPTPLLDRDQRIAMTNKGRELPGQTFITSESPALCVPSEGFYSKLLKGLGFEQPVFKNNDPRIPYVLRYKTGDTQTDNRSGYINWLMATGQAVVAEDGIVWTYPITDVRVKTERTKTTIANLFEAVDPIVSPELLIVTNLIHQANGQYNDKWDNDFVNEAIFAFYKLDEFSPAELAALGKKITEACQDGGGLLIRVAKVRWEKALRYIDLGCIDATDHEDDRAGIRDTVSGLPMAA